MKFLRRGSRRYLKFGKKRKKIQTWRKPKGRDNKMREKKKGYPAVVSIGYGNEKKLRGKIDGKIPIMINNTRDLEKIGKDQIAILGKIGKKKKIEIAKMASEKNIEVYNLNPKRFLKRNEKKQGQGPASVNKNKENKK
jgi:large subunit ribosomal protein L32e